MKIISLLMICVLLKVSVLANNSDLIAITSLYGDEIVNVEDHGMLSLNIKNKSANSSIIPVSFSKKLEKINQLQLSYNHENSLGYLKFIFKF